MLLIFILSNRDPVTVDFLFVELNTSQWVVLDRHRAARRGGRRRRVRPSTEAQGPALLTRTGRQALGGIQCPALTGSAVPVTHFASGEAKNTTAPAISDECGR